MIDDVESDIDTVGAGVGVTVVVVLEEDVVVVTVALLLELPPPPLFFCTVGEAVILLSVCMTVVTGVAYGELGLEVEIA